MPGRKIRYDENAESAEPGLPGFLARPADAPVYHGFTVVPETETDGWVLGVISEYDCDEPQTEGDAFVIAPDGSRAGIAWATDTPDFYEIIPPGPKRWGVYGVRFPQPVGCLEDLIANFRAVLPHLKQKFSELQEATSSRKEANHAPPGEVP